MPRVFFITKAYSAEENIQQRSLIPCGGIPTKPALPSYLRVGRKLYQCRNTCPETQDNNRFRFNHKIKEHSPTLYYHTNWTPVNSRGLQMIKLKELDTLKKNTQESPSSEEEMDIKGSLEECEAFEIDSYTEHQPQSKSQPNNSQTCMININSYTVFTSVSIILYAMCSFQQRIKDINEEKEP